MRAGTTGQDSLVGAALGGVVAPQCAKPALEQCRVACNDHLAGNVWRMVLEAPHCAQSAVSGQFAHIGLEQERDSVLRVPISIHGFSGCEGTIELMYQAIGPSTRLMAAMRPGDECSSIGPLGRGFSVPAPTGAAAGALAGGAGGELRGGKRALIVAGGLGAAPVATLAEHYSACGWRTDIVLGAATAELLVCKERLAKSASTLAIATDDGTEGDHGFVTVPLGRLLEEATERDEPYSYAAVCGPLPMMRNCARMLMGANVPCEVSMERLMACGVGACLSCIVPLVGGKTKRACVDGPVFAAGEVAWDEC